MKTTLSLLALSLVVGPLTPGLALAQSQPARPDQPRQNPPAETNSTAAGTVEVDFVQPDKFTDLRSSHGQLNAEERYLTELRQNIERVASSRLAPGQRLQVNITDVDMAGEFEPHRGSEFADTRIVKDVYPPRIRLNFRLTDASGGVVAQGERTLTNLTFNQTLRQNLGDDPLRHEKALLDNFIRDITSPSRTARAP